MQPYFPPANAGGFSVGAAFGAAAGNPSHLLAANPAAAGSRQDFRAGAQDRPASGRRRDDDLLSPDLQGLLGIRRARDLRRATSPLQDARDLLDRRLAEVRRWLATDDIRARLQERGMTGEDVEAQLRLRAENALRLLRQEAAAGGVVFPLVPGSHYLFGQSILDAEMLLPDAPPVIPEAAPTAATGEAAAPTTATIVATAAPATTTTTPTTTTTTPTTTTTTAGAADATPAPDPALRRKALEALVEFRLNYLRVLPQFMARSVNSLLDLRRGEVEFMDPAHMAVSFPCAVGLTRGDTRSRRLKATYPQAGDGDGGGEGAGTHVRQPLVNGMAAVVARTPGSSRVRISLDGYHWKTTAFYTDAVVEQAKLVMWRDILARARRLQLLIAGVDQWVR